MIITDTFVMLNLPKTGSTFSRKVIQKAYANKYYNLPLLERTMVKLKLKKKPYSVEDYFVQTINAHQLVSQHGAYIQIPENSKNKNVYSILRSPYEALESRYEFEHWKRHPLLSEEYIETHYPNFKNLSFKEYINFAKDSVNQIHKEKYNIPAEVKVGGLSIQMILMFFKEPFKVLENLSQQYLHSKEFKNDIAPITFLNNANLNEDLYQMLLEEGLDEEEVSFIKNADKVHVTKREKNSRQDLWDKETKAYMEEYEALALQIFNEFISNGKSA